MEILAEKKAKQDDDDELARKSFLSACFDIFNICYFADSESFYQESKAV